jgi:hypothetical protein
MKKGESAWNKGLKASLETRDKMSLSHKGVPFTKSHVENLKKSFSKRDYAYLQRNRPNSSGAKHWNWKGGGTRAEKLRKRRMKKLDYLATKPRSETCEICGSFREATKKAMCFDHDHKTGKFRGWICYRCNMALGLVMDNIGILGNMIQYLQKAE